MKKIFAILFFLLLFIRSIIAQDFNAEQLKLRSEIKQFLTEEGFMPEINSDGDIKFKKEGKSYFIIIDNRDTFPMYLSLSKFYNYGDIYTKESISKYLNTLHFKKAVKLLLFDAYYSFRAEMYLVNADTFKYSFYKLLSQLDAMENELESLMEE